MKIKLVTLTLFTLFFSACSEKSPQKSEDNVIKQEAAALSLISGSGDFGALTASKIATLTIQNTGTSATSEAVMLSVTGANASDFPIVYSSGCNQIIDKSKKCTLKISFSISGKSPGSYAATLNLGSLLSVPLSASIPQPEGSTTGGSSTGGSSGGSGSSGLVALVGSVDSSSGVEFGDFVGTQSVVKTINIKNIGTTTLPAMTASLSSTNFSLAYNQCSNISLKANQQCQVKISFSSAGKIPQPYTSNLIFSSLSVPLTANVLSSAGGTSGGTSGGSSGGNPTVSLILLENSVEVANPLNFGSYSGTQSVIKTVFLKNTGTAPVSVVTQLSNANFSLVYNQCNNLNLAVNGTCQMKISFTASNKVTQVYSSSLEVPAHNISFPLQATVAGIVCPSNQHLENGSCVDNVIACSISNGVGSRTWNGSSYGPCTLVSCNSGYEAASNQCVVACAEGKHREGSFCVNDVRSCFIANGTGTQSWAAGVWSSCAVVSCNSTHHQNDNVCDSNEVACLAGELPNNSTAGIKTWDGSQYGSCVATGCSPTYELYQGQCYAQLQVSPNNQVVNSGEVLNLNVTGGVPPYSYQIDPASTITSTVEAFSGNNAVGVFTAGVNSGINNVQESVKITDQRGIFVSASLEVSPSNVSLPLALDGNGSILLYGLTYTFNATGGTPPYVYSVTSYIGSVVDANTGEFTPGDNQQIDLVSDVLRVTDNTGAFIDIILNIASNLQVLHPTIYNPNNGLNVSSHSDNDSMIQIVVKNTTPNKYLRVFSDSNCSGNQIYEGVSYGGDMYASDGFSENYDVSRTYSVSEEDYDTENYQPLYTNVVCSPYTASYYYDITPPEIYSVAAVSAGGNNINLTVGTSGGGTVSYYKDLTCTESIGGNNSNDIFTYDVGSSPGVFFFTAIATDEAGNTSECSNGGNSNGMTMNQYAIYEHLLGDSGLYPIITGNTIDNGIAYYNQSYIPVYVYGNGIEYEYADLFLDSSCSTPVAQATTTGSSPYNLYNSGYFVYGDIFNDTNLNPITDGTYQVYARRGLDQTSNFCSVASIPIVIDTQAPPAINLSLAQGTFNNTGNIEFNFGGIESNVSLVLGRKCQNAPYGVFAGVDTLQQLANVTSSTYSYNLGDGGFYRFAVSTRDRAGNYSQCSNTITYEYDNGRPYITDISSSTADGVYGLGQTVNIRLTFNKAIQKLNNNGSISLKVSNSINRNLSLTNATVSGNHLDFSYVVQNGDNSGTTGRFSVESFSNFGGAIVDANNNLLLANTKIPDSGINKRLEEKHNLRGDGVGPSAGIFAFALTGGGGNFSNSTQSSAPVNITNQGNDQGGGFVAGFEVAIGTSTSNRTNILNWTDVGSGPNNLAATGLSLSTGTAYYLSVRSYDNFGNKSNAFSFGGNTYGIFTVDNLPPLAKIAWVDDREFGTSSVQTMSINFPVALNSSGVESADVANYFVAIGTEPGGTSILNWSNINNHNLNSLYNGTSQERYKLQVTGINLNTNTIYYASIRYCDFASNCKEAYGNGFTLKNSDGFSQKNYMKSSNRVSNGKYGSAVALEGNYMVVGAPGEGLGGRVYVYKRVAGTNQLIEETILTASNGESGDEFGAAVAISGNRILVGAPGEDGSSNDISNSGAAYIFKKTTSWTQETVLRAHNAGADDRFGDRVKISQLNAAVSALYEDSDHTAVSTTFVGFPADNNNVSNSGAVYTYTVDNTTQLWSQDGYIKKANSGTCGTGGSQQCSESANDNFGFAIDLKGPVLVVGTPYHDLAFVGSYNNYITLGGGTGTSNATYRAAYQNSGAVYIFHKQTYLWAVAYNLRSPNIDPGDEFGYSVAINEIDSTSNNHSELPTNIPNYMIAVGAPGEDHGSFISSLHQEIYQGGGVVDGSTNRRFLTNSSTLPIFGTSGSTGTYLNNNVSNSGAVYLFAYEPIWQGQNINLTGGVQPLAMHLYSYVKSPNLGVDDRFGSSLALVGNVTFGWDRTVNPMAPTSIQRAVSYLVVGAPKEDNSATGIQLWFSANDVWNGSSIISDNNSSTDSGAVYVFKHGYENTYHSGTFNQRSDFVLQQYIKPPVSKAGDEFGSQIAASVNSWIIGVPLDDADASSTQSSSGSSDTSMSNSGAAYIINSLD